MRIKALSVENDLIKFSFQPSFHYICNNLTCMEDVVALQDLEDKICMFWIAENFFRRDIQPMQYFGWISYLFSLSNVYMLVLDFNLQNNDRINYDTVAQALLIVPNKSIFVNIMHSEVSIHPREVMRRRYVMNRPDTILLHLNHEMPWVEQMINNQYLNFVYGNNTELLNTYSMYNAVFRQYYYEPLQQSHATMSVSCKNMNPTSSVQAAKSMMYIPLGPTYYSYKYKGYSTKYSHSNPISNRSILCFIASRFNYPTTSPYHNERHEIQQLLNQHVFPCEVYEESRRLEFKDYMELLNNTVFAPCPSGNNPETFRHYEALEMGCIPLFINWTYRVQQLALWNGHPESEHDLQYETDKFHDYFLNSDLWKSYPGPIFTTWAELDPFLYRMSHNKSAIVDMQIAVQSWYKLFKKQIKLDIKNVVDQVFFT